MAPHDIYSQLVPPQLYAPKRDIQLRTLLIDSCDQQSNAKWPTHHALFPVCAFSKSQGQITDCLRTALYSQSFIVMEAMVLTLDAGVFNHGASVRLQAGHGAPYVGVYLDNLFDGGGFEKGRSYALLDTEKNAMRGGNLGTVVSAFRLHGTIHLHL